MPTFVGMTRGIILDACFSGTWQKKKEKNIKDLDSSFRWNDDFVLDSRSSPWDDGLLDVVFV